ncbi:MAG: thioredoxin-disulfide reductase [Thermodesulfobacteriota bacterium]|nr:thioredoxin-disulfide reductase [Thermodesulfobacteriota bacterium]
MPDNNIQRDTYDIIIIGGGPGGLTAGLYAARANMKVLLLEGNAQASQITMTDMIENYPGISEINGFELNNMFKKQAISFGLEIRPEQVDSINRKRLRDTEVWEVITGNDTYQTLSVIISTGASWSSLGVPGEQKFMGRGISYCATCDAPFYRGREVVVIGGGDTAIEEALYLTKFASRVTVIHRRDRLRATAILQQRAFANEKITFAWDSIVEEILGDDVVTGVKIKNVKTPDSYKDIPVDGAFIFVGLVPNTAFIKGVVDLDKGGYIITDRDMKTSATGMFACGDCISKSLRQVVTACGDGATAAHSASLHVDELKGQAY